MEQDNSFNYKKSWIDLHKGRGLALLETSKESSIAHFNAIVGYSKIAINGALLLNGTVCVQLARYLLFFVQGSHILLNVYMLK